MAATAEFSAPAHAYQPGPTSAACLTAKANQDLGATVVMVLHDLNLAARYAHHLVAMKDGRIESAGHPKETLTAELVSRVFGVESTIVPDPRTGRPVVLPAF